MIIPVRCFTCGKVIADKWAKFEKMCAEKRDDEHPDIHPSFEQRKGAVMDKLGITKICCRRHFLGHVDLIDVV